jgi:hypothetical protein
MNPDEVPIELAFAALAGHWSAELTDAVAQVARSAATDPVARVLAEDWVRRGKAEHVWNRGTGVDVWITILGWLAWLNEEELTDAIIDSLRASFNAVMGFLGHGLHRSTSPRTSLDEEF